MSWFKPLDPSGGLLGSGGRYTRTTGAPPRPVPPPVPAPRPAVALVAPVPEDPPQRAQARRVDVPSVVAPSRAASQPVLVPVPHVAASAPIEIGRAYDPDTATAVPAEKPRARLHPETVRGRILIAAALVCEGKLTRPVSNADVIVRAWQEWPETFGLRGYAAQHPDSNRVAAKLSGVGGLVEEGWLSRPSVGELLLTRRGAWWWRVVGATWLAEQKAGT